jgi:DNA-binding CsgD family transcriptional regulator
VIGVGAVLLLMGVEIATESEPIPLGELLAEALKTGLIVVAATGVSLLTGRLQTERDEKVALSHDLEMARVEGSAWRERAQGYLSGLGEEIEKQFEQWQLTAAEREVGLLMLKGFAHGEIAGLRGTTEATVRHQARAVYQKSSLPGAGQPARSTRNDHEETYPGVSLSFHGDGLPRGRSPGHRSARAR